jgi:hypothetical protein
MQALLFGYAVAHNGELVFPHDAVQSTLPGEPLINETGNSRDKGLLASRLGLGNTQRRSPPLDTRLPVGCGLGYAAAVLSCQGIYMPEVIEKADSIKDSRRKRLLVNPI